MLKGEKHQILKHADVTVRIIVKQHKISRKWENMATSSIVTEWITPSWIAKKSSYDGAWKNMKYWERRKKNIDKIALDIERILNLPTCNSIQIHPKSRSFKSRRREVGAAFPFSPQQSNSNQIQKHLSMNPFVQNCNPSKYIQSIQVNPIHPSNSNPIHIP